MYTVKSRCVLRAETSSIKLQVRWALERDRVRLSPGEKKKKEMGREESKKDL